MRPRFAHRAWWSLFLSFFFCLFGSAAASPSSVWLGYEFGDAVPLTAQTAVNSLYAHDGGPLITTTLLPIGTVLDPLVTTYMCIYLSAEETANVLSAGDKKIFRAQDDAALHVATAGDYRSARLEAAFEHLKGFWYFDHSNSLQLASFILAVSSPGSGVLER